MSDTSDVKLLTLNTKTVFNTSAAIERVKIHNNSSFFLRVYFGADAPTDPTSGAGWHDTIDPGGTPLMEIVGNSAQTFSNRSYVQSTPYQGVITVMPFLPVGALQSSGGIVFGAALAYVSAYYPGEWAEQGGEIEAYVQGATQARGQVAGPGAAYSIPPLALDNTTPNNTDITIASIGVSNIQAANQALNAGASIVNLYLWEFAVSFHATSVATATLKAIPQFFISDSTGAIIRSSIVQPFALFLAAANFASDYKDKNYTAPLLIQFTINAKQLATTDLVRMRYASAALQSGTWQAEYSGEMTLDHFNQSPLMAFADYAQSVGYVTAPWAQTNPQLY